MNNRIETFSEYITIILQNGMQNGPYVRTSGVDVFSRPEVAILS